MENTRDLQAIATGGIPAQATYCQGNENLRLQVQGGGQGNRLIFGGRFLRPDGIVVPLSYNLQSNGNLGTPDTLTVPLAQGWILNLTAMLFSTSSGFSNALARADLILGTGSTATVLATLLQENVSGGRSAAFPSASAGPAFAAHGSLRSITGTNPAANAEISETVTNGGRWKLRAFRVTLVTDANPANREVELVFDDGTAEFARVSAGANIVASKTTSINFLLGVQHKSAATALTLMVPLPDLELKSGYRVRTVTTNLQVTDDYGAPQYLTEEWIDAP